MTGRPDLFLLNVAYDATGVHGHVFFRDPPGTMLRQVFVRSTDAGSICEPAHRDTRPGWETFLKETRWLIALTQPDAPAEAS
ncbi:hypothetical protein JOE58_002579 [Curtobacterium luteum]|uniref:Uncharacterized protein n=1 Tax=Curtobacterium luteum TaxID=33881 RepID=A0A8H9GA98_9MICO|nr:hypothetical protein [Curtobacterium luteum]MBM7803328.1 hypothetical protein [Curtobacterium luteum]NUU51639.1 hypothetical protein [Curtobacterium luteum]GGL08065.1 hypothetical protein GCM10009769_27840 [Curtobacterium luteum]